MLELLEQLSGKVGIQMENFAPNSDFQGTKEWFLKILKGSKVSIDTVGMNGKHLPALFFEYEDKLYANENVKVKKMVVCKKDAISKIGRNIDGYTLAYATDVDFVKKSEMVTLFDFSLTPETEKMVNEFLDGVLALFKVWYEMN